MLQVENMRKSLIAFEEASFAEHRHNVDGEHN